MKPKLFSAELLRAAVNQGDQTRNDLFTRLLYSDGQQGHSVAHAEMTRYHDTNPVVTDGVMDIDGRPAEHVAIQQPRRFPLSGVRVIEPTINAQEEIA